MATGLFEKRIRYLVAVSLVLLVTFSIRLVDVQAVRAAGYANRADLELAKKKTNDNPVFYVQYAHARIAGVLRNAQEL
ncbi:MAG: hypothetical protein ACO3QQ_06650, partial [Candidatus Nanopelagicaceae bacterium]